MVCTGQNAQGKSVRAVLRAVTSRINRDAPVYTAQHVTMITYGMKSMSSSSGEVRHLLLALKPLIMHSSEYESESLLNHQFASAMFGLQGMSSDEFSVRAYLQALLSRISDGSEKSCREFSGQELGMACHGMRSMNNRWTIVRECLNVINSRVEVSLKHRIVMDPGEISMALHGMQGMKCSAHRAHTSNLNIKKSYNLSDVGLGGFNVVEGLGIVSTQPVWVVENEDENWVPVATDVPHEEEHLVDTVQFSRCSGDASNESGSLKRLLCYLGKIIAYRKESLSLNQIGLALYGLRGMSANCSEAVEVESIIEFLTEDLEATLLGNNLCVSDCRSIASAFFGLQKMSSEGVVVRCMLRQLGIYLEKLLSINGQTVGNILFGMQCMSSSTPEVREILNHLSEKIGKIFVFAHCVSFLLSD